MKNRQNKQEVKYLLKQIANQPTKQSIKQSEVRYFLENKVDRLQVENRVLAEQLSQQISNRQTLTLLLADERQKYEQALQTINKISKIESQPLTRISSHERLKYLKQSNSNRKQSATLINDIQNRKLKEKVQNLQAELQQVKCKSEKDEMIIKQLKQELLFSRQHLKRAQQEKNELQFELEEGRNQIFEANQLMARQNKQILNMKFELARSKHEDSGHRINLAPFYFQDLEDLQKQLQQILYLTVKDHDLREQIRLQTKQAIKQLKCSWLNIANKQQS